MHEVATSVHAHSQGFTVILILTSLALFYLLFAEETVKTMHELLTSVHANSHSAS